MHRIDHPVLHIARFTLGARTALSIGTGGSDGVYDHPLVRDANGLPMIPGTSLAGVLRHLWYAEHDEASTNDLFGYQDRDDGHAARLEVSVCVLQDSDGAPVEGLLLGPAGGQRLRDPLLAAARATQDDPLFRDRVSLTHRGVAAEATKFDRGLLAAGHRFSGELRLWSSDQADPAWARLLGLLADPRLRLGGATRAGLGAIELIALHVVSLDLRQPHDIERFRSLGAGLGDHAGLAERAPSQLPVGSGLRTLRIRLTPRDFWRIGQGDAPVARYSKEPDLVPKLEPMVRWTTGKGVLDSRVALVPGSSVKGALAHRTAFHWNVLNGVFVDADAKSGTDGLTAERLESWNKSEHCEGVRAIFGYAKNRADAAGRTRDDTGQAGRLLFDDVHLDLPAADLAAEIEKQLQAMIHNSLDRFTGGVRARMLFTEELIYRRDFDLTIQLLPGIDAIDASARRAFARALRDLCEGRLGLGGGVTKGHGSFAGEPDAETQHWLAEQGEPWTPSSTLEAAA